MSAPQTIEQLLDAEAIKAVKYAYVRCVDQKTWDEMATLLTADCVADYASGKLHYEGRDAVIAFLRDSLNDPQILTSHRVHQPEITFAGPDRATAVWALDDVVIMPAANMTLRGAAFYTDEMVKQDGGWKIARTGYHRLYEEMEPRDHPGLTITDRWADHVA
jgi:uncharacterized protein (TIGR02246 family)